MLMIFLRPGLFSKTKTFPQCTPYLYILIYIKGSKCITKSFFHRLFGNHLLKQLGFQLRKDSRLLVGIEEIMLSSFSVIYTGQLSSIHLSLLLIPLIHPFRLHIQFSFDQKRQYLPRYTLLFVNIIVSLHLGVSN